MHSTPSKPTQNPFYNDHPFHAYVPQWSLPCRFSNHTSLIHFLNDLCKVNITKFLDPKLSLLFGFSLRLRFKTLLLVLRQINALCNNKDECL